MRPALAAEVERVAAAYRPGCSCPLSLEGLDADHAWRAGAARRPFACSAVVPPGFNASRAGMGVSTEEEEG